MIKAQQILVVVETVLLVLLITFAFIDKPAPIDTWGIVIGSLGVSLLSIYIQKRSR
jgi:hypothetical protein